MKFLRLFDIKKLTYKYEFLVKYFKGNRNLVAFLLSLFQSFRGSQETRNQSKHAPAEL